jgi:hypothetical protein
MIALYTLLLLTVPGVDPLGPGDHIRTLTSGWHDWFLVFTALRARRGGELDH